MGSRLRSCILPEVTQLVTSTSQIRHHLTPAWWWQATAPSTDPTTPKAPQALTTGTSQSLPLLAHEGRTPTTLTLQLWRVPKPAPSRPPWRTNPAIPQRSVALQMSAIRGAEQRVGNTVLQRLPQGLSRKAPASCDRGPGSGHATYPCLPVSTNSSSSNRI